MLLFVLANLDANSDMGQKLSREHIDQYIEMLVHFLLIFFIVSVTIVLVLSMTRLFYSCMSCAGELQRPGSTTKFSGSSSAGDCIGEWIFLDC
jgi:hypothetical protein